MSSALPLPFFGSQKVEMPEVTPVPTSSESDDEEARQRLAEARRREAARLAGSRSSTRATGASGLSSEAAVARKTLG